MGEAIFNFLFLIPAAAYRLGATIVIGFALFVVAVFFAIFIHNMKKH